MNLIGKAKRVALLHVLLLVCATIMSCSSDKTLHENNLQSDTGWEVESTLSNENDADSVETQTTGEADQDDVPESQTDPSDKNTLEQSEDDPSNFGEFIPAE